MKRKQLWFCFCLGSGIVCGYYLKWNMRQLCAFCAAAVFLCISAILICAAKKRKAWKWKTLKKPEAKWFFLAGLLFFVFGALSMRHLELNEFASSGFDGRLLKGEGTVLKCEKKEGYSLLTVRSDELGEKLLIRYETDDMDAAYGAVGCRVSFSGMAELPRGRRNPGCFDYSLYLKGRGIRLIVRVNSYRLEKLRMENRFLHFLSLAKLVFLKRIMAELPEEESGLLAGLLFGEKSYIDDDIYEEFRNNGTAHVLAVSGLHVGLLYAAAVKLLGGRKGIPVSIVTIGLLLCYAALSNFSVSVLRASLMIVLHIMAFHLKRRYDMVSAASLGGVVFMSLNPYTIFDSGFQLSFCAAYAMGVALPWASLKIVKWSDRLKSDALFHIGNILAPAFMVQLAMAPLTAFHFLNYSLIAPLINPVAVAIAGLLVPAGLGAFVLGGWSGLLNRVCGLGAAILIRLNSAASGLEYSHFGVAAPPFGLLLLYYIFFFFFFSETRFMLCRKGRYGMLAGLCTALFFGACALPRAFGITDSLLPWKYLQYDVCFVDVGQGDCIHIRSGGKNLLLDGGGNYYTNTGRAVLREYLLKNGVRKLDMALVSHLDMDHCKGLGELSGLMEIKEFAFSAADEGDSRLAAFRSPVHSFLSAGDRIELGKEARLEILYPLKGAPASADDNENCLVALLNIKGISMLLTGDMTAGTEEDCLRRYPSLKADLLKIAHHGSAYSTEEGFVRALAPEWAVISCGRNNPYGHPAARVIDLLEDSGIIYGRTDLDGAICASALPDGSVSLRNASGSRLTVSRDKLYLKEEKELKWPILSIPSGLSER